MYDLGDVWHGTIEVRDLDGALTDSTVVLNITLPDQTVAGPFIPTHDGPGKYHYDYTIGQAGRHAAKWAGTSVAFGHTDVLDVEGPDISVVSVTDVKRQLGIGGTTSDDELRSYILSASENIENMCGPCAVRAFTERISADGAIWLSNTPVVSLTSITPVHTWTQPLAVSDVTLNPASGKVSRLDGWRICGEYDIESAAGRAVIPASIRLACMLIVQHLWDTRRGVLPGPGGGDDEVTLPGWGYAIPNRAAELLGGFRNQVLIA